MSDANEAAIEDHPNTGITEGPEVEAADQQSEPDNGHQVAAEAGTDTQRDDVVKPGSPFFDIPSFLTVAERCVAAAQSTVREHETREQRVLKRFSVAEVAEALNCNRNYLYKYLLDLDGARRRDAWTRKYLLHRRYHEAPRAERDAKDGETAEYDSTGGSLATSSPSSRSALRKAAPASPCLLPTSATGSR